MTLDQLVSRLGVLLTEYLTAQPCTPSERYARCGNAVSALLTSAMTIVTVSVKSPINRDTWFRDTVQVMGAYLDEANHNDRLKATTTTTKQKDMQ
jgi:hypothetical protein